MVRCAILMICLVGCRSGGDEVPLADGIYVVRSSGATLEELGEVGPGLVVRAYDHSFVSGGSEMPVEYLVLERQGFAPLQLEGEPVTGESNGKGFVHLQLNELGATELERLTGHADRAAIIIGDDVVTAHRVRSAITGGSLQVSC